MGNIIKGTLVFIITTMISFILIYKTTPPIPSLKEKKDWTGSRLNLLSVTSRISNENCYLNENKLACIHAINNSLKEFGMSLDKDGKFINKSYIAKKDLASWENNQSVLDFDKIITKIEELYNDKNREYNYGLLINGYLSITKDPFSYILPKEKYTLNLGKFQTGEEFFLGRTKKEKKYYFTYVAEDSDLYIKGLRQGDILTNFNDLEINKNTKLEEIYKEIENKLWRIVTSRDGQKRFYRLNKNYKKISLEPSKIIDNKIGYIRVKKFYTDLCSDIKKDLIKLNKSNIKELIIDLRYNGGGILEEAGCIANLFLPKYRLMYLAQNFNQVVVESGIALDDPIYFGNLYVLVNASSASASEVLAGALKFNDRALLIGQKTFGKGIFQDCEHWKENDKFLYCQTAGFFLNPNQRSPQAIGITPDIQILIDNELQHRQTDLYYKIVENPRFWKDLPQATVNMSDKIYPDPELSFTIDFIEKYDSYIGNIPE